MSEDAPIAATGHAPAVKSTKDLLKVAVGALGVVYGDIGTSPLYAVKECFTEPHGVARTPQNVLGILSLITWALTLVIVVKYLSFIMRADNRGEGGTFALLALVSDRRREGSSHKRSGVILVFLGLFGASLLYGEGMLTPAISVLSAIEGLGVATHAFERWVVPITCAILIALFLVQKRGTAKVGAIFGPATLVWFLTIAAIGAPWIARRPEVLQAINPVHAVRFFVHNRFHGFLILGSVVLCITGGEALYADMGHFGKQPIRVAWYSIVFPALLVNYYGQGALLLERGAAVKNTFYELVSGWMLYPLVGIAALATVVASQALISGAYSLTQQAVQLGYFPRVTIVHTSGEAEGQIYIPEVNGILMVACLSLVLAFQESTKLAAAYGIAVTGTMSITSLLFFALAVKRWGWSPWKAGALVALFLAVDLPFFAANIVKFTHGGWFPIAMGVVVFSVLTTWKRGRAALGAYMLGAALPIDMFITDVEQSKPYRVRGTAIFMTSNPEGAPPVLLHHFKHNKVLHEQIILLSIQTRHVPEVSHEERVQVRDLGHGLWQVIATYGFMQTPNVVEVLQACVDKGLDPGHELSFFLGRETLLTTGRSGMASWRKALFSFLSRNARPANAFFRIPPNRVIELGIQIEL
ncbi:MAG: potassium transporter Kup [Deltaproteobacteria bacterium]|nr:potassium transporter Kup [Deltaproteobacteria bacterium]